MKILRMMKRVPSRIRKPKLKPLLGKLVPEAKSVNSWDLNARIKGCYFQREILSQPSLIYVGCFKVNQWGKDSRWVS